MGLFTKLNWILEGRMFGRNKHLLNVPAVYWRGGGTGIRCAPHVCGGASICPRGACVAAPAYVSITDLINHAFSIWFSVHILIHGPQRSMLRVGTFQL